MSTELELEEVLEDLEEVTDIQRLRNFLKIGLPTSEAGAAGLAGIVGVPAKAN